MVYAILFQSIQVFNRITEKQTIELIDRLSNTVTISFFILFVEGLSFSKNTTVRTYVGVVILGLIVYYDITVSIVLCFYCTYPYVRTYDDKKINRTFC